jgi:hypothetical protein
VRVGEAQGNWATRQIADLRFYAGQRDAAALLEPRPARAGLYRGKDQIAAPTIMKLLQCLLNVAGDANLLAGYYQELEAYSDARSPRPVPKSNPTHAL